MNVLKIATATALVAFSAASFAAKPTSIVFNANGENAEGTVKISAPACANAR